VIGIAFKIAAVPMHFYTPDVYQGSSSGVASMLAFVPKTAGFVALILVLATVGWVSTSPATHGQLPEPLHSLLWIMAALTMTVGNVLAVMQNSIKRMLGYSSVAHSGYMLVALLAGPGPEGASLTRNGLSAVLFYLIVYAVANLGCFAVLGCLEKTSSDGKSEEIDHIDDIRGLISTRPLLAWVMAVCSLSLLGLPPLLGFMGKLPIFSTGLAAGEIVLVVILGLNSAIAAYYYIRIAKNAILEQSPVRPAGEEIRDAAVPARQFAGIIAGLGTVVLAIIPISSLAIDGGTFRHSRSGVTNSPAQTLPAPVGSAEPATADAPTGPVADATVPPTIAR
ncbi:MAG: NADH-quinone oxidoreductase subunit N, partial [Planctomyces sp.]